ncbi:hypothetical protein PG995_002189 [Apiospora arundinis]
MNGSLPGPAAAGSTTTPHSQYILVVTKNAKCDMCNQRNKSTMQKCSTCGLTTCATCHAQGRYEPRHNLAGMNLSWNPPAVNGAARRGGNRSRGRPGSVRQSLSDVPAAAPSVSPAAVAPAAAVVPAAAAVVPAAAAVVPAAAAVVPAAAAVVPAAAATRGRGRGRGRGRPRGRSGLVRQSINAGPPAPAAASSVAGSSTAGTPPVPAIPVAPLPAVALPAAAPLTVGAAPIAPPHPGRKPLPSFPAQTPAGFRARKSATFAVAAAAAAPAPSRATEADENKDTDKGKGKAKEDIAMADAPAPAPVPAPAPAAAPISASIPVVPARPLVYDDAEIRRQAIHEFRHGINVARVRREQNPLRALDMIEASATLTAMANGVTSMPLFHDWLSRMRAWYGIG